MTEVVFQFPYFNFLTKKQYLLRFNAFKHQGAVQHRCHFEKLWNSLPSQRTGDFRTGHFLPEFPVREKLVEMVNVLGFFSVDLLIEDRVEACNSAYFTSLAQEWQEIGNALEYAHVF